MTPLKIALSRDFGVLPGRWLDSGGSLFQKTFALYFNACIKFCCRKTIILVIIVRTVIVFFAAIFLAVSFGNSLIFADVRGQTPLYNAEQFARMHPDGNYVLAADIFWDRTPIETFRGTLDGAGFEIRGMANALGTPSQSIAIPFDISNFRTENALLPAISDAKITSQTRNCSIGGIFKTLDGAEIRNLKIADMRVCGDFGGILAGEIRGGIIEDVTIFGGEIRLKTPESVEKLRPPLKFSSAVGGLTGAARDVQIRDILVHNVRIVHREHETAHPPEIADALPSPEESENIRFAVGGLAGILQNCNVERTYVLNAEIMLAKNGQKGGNAVFGNANDVSAGGFVGIVSGNSTFEDCVAVADVYASGVSGGFAGIATGSCTSIARDTDLAEKQRRNIGAEFTRCRSRGTVRGETAGGFIGRLSGRSRVAHSHAIAEVTANNAGGFAGEITNSSRIEFSSAGSEVFGEQNAGGFVAKISDVGAPNTITNSLALGRAVAGGNARRFAALQDHDGVNNCYAALGMVLIRDGQLAHVIPNPYSADGGDISRSKIDSLQ